jgi:hypothetical protein
MAHEGAAEADLEIVGVRTKDQDVNCRNRHAIRHCNAAAAGNLLTPASCARLITTPGYAWPLITHVG